MSVLGPLRFLIGDGDLSAARNVLVIQTGSPELLTKAVDLVSTALPAASVTVLLQRDMAGKVSPRQGVEYLENTGGKRDLTRQLRARSFDAAFVLYFNQPGFWKLKLLPFALGVRNVLAVNENMGWFPVSLRHAGPFARHLIWRLGGAGVGGDGAAMVLAERLLRAAVKPAVIARLVVYEKLASLRADTSWKRGNRVR